MRKFFTFGPDPSRDDLQSWIEEDLAGFDFANLLSGEPVDHLPPDFAIYVSDDKPTDLLGNPYGWVIMSRRALAAVSTVVPDNDLQILVPHVVGFYTRKPVGDYRIVNCLRVIPALAFPRGEDILYKDRVVIKEQLVPPNIHAFRLAEEPRFWIISDHLFQALTKLEGIVGTVTQTIS